MANKLYCYSYDEEHYTGLFKSRHEAAKEAMAENLNEHFFTAEAVHFEPSVSAIRVIDQIQNEALDLGHEWVDGYLHNLSAESMDELEKELNRVFDKWVEKYNLEPNFFKAEKVIQHDKRGRPV